MKKMVSMIALAMLSLQVATARDVVTMDTDKLPSRSKEIIKKSFPESNISYIKIDTEAFWNKTYEVTLTDGTELEFDKQGDWLEIDMKKAQVPALFIPAPITEYVNQHFEGQHIVKIEKVRRGYEVELSNDLDILFDAKGRMLKLDD